MKSQKQQLESTLNKVFRTSNLSCQKHSRCAGSEDFAIFNAVKRTAFGDLLVKLIESCTKQISLARQAIFKLFYRADLSPFCVPVPVLRPREYPWLQLNTICMPQNLTAEVAESLRGNAIHKSLRLEGGWSRENVTQGTILCTAPPIGRLGKLSSYAWRACPHKKFDQRDVSIENCISNRERIRLTAGA